MQKNIFLFRFWVQLGFSSAILILFLFPEADNKVYFIIIGFFTALFCIFILQILLRVSSIKFNIQNSIRALFSWFILYLIFDYFNSEIFFNLNNVSVAYFLICGVFNNLLIFISFKEFNLKKEQVILISSFKDTKISERYVVAKLLNEKEINDLQNLIKSVNISKIFINLDYRNHNFVELVVNEAKHTNIDVYLVSNQERIRFYEANETFFIDKHSVLVTKNSFESNPLSKLIKRFFDFFACILLIITLSPFLLLISLLIKIDSKGPVLFMQERNGQNGKIFIIYKFRTMYVHESELFPQAKKDDPRVTKIGKILRKLSIDELPQLLNIFSGEMSFVGPRPHAVIHNKEYASKIKNYTFRFKAKPGLTGLAQIRGYRGETDSLDLMIKRVNEDIKYVESWSLWKDVKILFLTPISLFKHKAY
tara:strand:- start:404 stop:1669 length:1266 start_codon:yes stop_codon:yes gene_type:complete